MSQTSSARQRRTVDVADVLVGLHERFSSLPHSIGETQTL
jgi:hypothetical protein